MKHFIRLLMLMVCLPSFGAVGNVYVGEFIDTQGTNTGGGIATPVSRTIGGTGFAMTNWIPSGATYTNNVSFGQPTYNVPVLSNGVYFAYIPGNGASNDQGFAFKGDLSGAQNTSGTFIPLTNNILANGPLTGTVYAQLYLVGFTNGFDTNGIYGHFGGYATLTLDNNSVVPSAALPANVVYNNFPFTFFTTNSDNKIYNTNDINAPGNGGSALSLIHYGTNGYADFGFYTAPNLATAIGSPTLRYAIGITPRPGSANIAYQNFYNEIYDTSISSYYVNSGSIWGGAQRLAPSLSPCWSWFIHGDTNQPLWRADPASGIVTNYGQIVVKSNATFQSSVTVTNGTSGTFYLISSAGNTNVILDSTDGRTSITASGLVTFNGGINTTTTNTYTITSTGYTNLGTNDIQIIDLTGTSITYSNANSKLTKSLGTLTTPSSLILKTNCSVKGTAMAAGAMEDL